MNKNLLVIFVVLGALLVPAYGTAKIFTKESAHDFSVNDRSVKAFSNSLENLDKSQEQQFILGQRIFHNFTSESKPFELKGIGPKFNAFNCADCHTKDGRGDPKKTPSLVVKLYNKTTSNKSDPIYGKQISIRSLTEDEVTENFDPQAHNLESQLLLGPLHRDTHTFRRIAPEIFGLGLIESIPQWWFKQNEDPNDEDNDGISGRINWIDINDKKEIGRFGWKASKATIEQQTLHAAYHDMGLNNSIFNDCGFLRLNCDLKNDLTTQQERNLVFYIKALAPPAQDKTSETNQGKEVFIKTGCASCHTISAPVEKNTLTKSAGLIYPHSDFLLHSMGKRLADPTPVFGAKADEFRTAPLWGFGLREKVNGSLNLLHDGRAKTIDEAISYHEGEAKKIRDRYFNLSSRQKQQLKDYLYSL